MLQVQVPTDVPPMQIQVWSTSTGALDPRCLAERIPKPSMQQQIPIRKQGAPVSAIAGDRLRTLLEVLRQDQTGHGKVAAGSSVERSARRDRTGIRNAQPFSRDYPGHLPEAAPVGTRHGETRRSARCRRSLPPSPSPSLGRTPAAFVLGGRGIPGWAIRCAEARGYMSGGQDGPQLGRNRTAEKRRLAQRTRPDSLGERPSIRLQAASGDLRRASDQGAATKTAPPVDRRRAKPPPKMMSQRLRGAEAGQFRYPLDGLISLFE